MALSSLMHLQASSGEWVVLVSSRGGPVQLRRYVLERLRCSTPFHLRTESLPPSLWVPSPIYALRSFCCSWSLVAFVVSASLLPTSSLPLFLYNCTCSDTLLTNRRVFSWSSHLSSPGRFPLALDPSTSQPLSGTCYMSTLPIPMPCSWSVRT